MFIKALGLLTPLAVGGVWAAGGFDGAVQGAPEQAAAVAEADPEVCDEIRASNPIGGNGKSDAGDLDGAIAGTLAAVDQLDKQDEALRAAGCPTSGGIKGALAAVGPNGVAAQLAEDMEEAAEEMDEAEWASDEAPDPSDFAKPTLDTSTE